MDKIANKNRSLFNRYNIRCNTCYKSFGTCYSTSKNIHNTNFIKGITSTFSTDVLKCSCEEKYLFISPYYEEEKQHYHNFKFADIYFKKKGPRL